MDDLKARVTALMREIMDGYLTGKWDRLIASGFDESDTPDWSVRLFHVVDEYESSLRHLIRVFEDDDPDIPGNLYGWAVASNSPVWWTIESMYEDLKSHFKYHIPPDEEADEE